MPDQRQFLDPGFLTKLDRLDLIARLVVEGFITGLHKSPYHGFSVEFAEHRPYLPGDDIRHIDWKLYARNDRYFLKQFEEETNLKTYLVLDISASMDFTSAAVRAPTRGHPSRATVSKLRYGVMLAAALTYLMLKQQDQVGLLTFDHEVRRFIPPRSVMSHLRVILTELAGITPGSRTATLGIFKSLAERIKRRGLIVVLSDLLDEPDQALMGLKHFRSRKHELILFHILDPWETTFPFNRDQVFVDLETGERITTQSSQVRSAYLNKMDELLRYYRRGCRENRIDYVPVSTDTPFDLALLNYLKKRERLY